MRSLGAIARWPGLHAAAAVARTHRGTMLAASTGPLDATFAFASVTKVATALAVLVEVGEGRSALEDAAGPPGATLAHLLSHASGLPLDGTSSVAPPGARRIYSNTGIELAAAHAARRAGTTVPSLLHRNVVEPLDLSRTTLEGSAASGMVGTTEALCSLAAELLVPTLVTPELARRARAVQFGGLAGVLPGFGRQDPCDWGLGVEVKGTKQPHWTGATWPVATFGHFGQAGGFVAVDATAGLAVVTLGDTPFGSWATESWPGFTDDVRIEYLGAAAALDDETIA